MDINAFITVPKDIQIKANQVRSWIQDIFADPESEKWFQELRSEKENVRSYEDLQDVRYAFRLIGLFTSIIINSTRKSVITYGASAIDLSEPIWEYTVDSANKAALMQARVPFYRALSNCDNLHREQPASCQCQVGVLTDAIAEHQYNGLAPFLKHSSLCPYIPTDIHDDVMYVLFSQLFSEILLHDKHHFGDWVEYWLGSMFNEEKYLSNLVQVIQADIRASVAACDTAELSEVFKKVYTGILEPTGALEALKDVRVYYDNSKFKNEVLARVESGELDDDDLAHLRQQPPKTEHSGPLH